MTAALLLVPVDGADRPDLITQLLREHRDPSALLV